MGVLRKMSSVRTEWYQFRDALEQGDFSAASGLLQKNPGLISERNSIGESILHFFAVENNQAAVEWLHNRGADLNARNEFGAPLLFEVALLGYRELLMWLVHHGADPKKKNADGQSIDEYLAECDKTEMLDFVKKRIIL